MSVDKLKSKIYKNDLFTNNEINIANYIYNIENYDVFFSPILKIHNINISKISKKKYIKYNKYIQYNKDIDYIVCDSLHIDGENLLETIMRDNTRTNIRIMFETYISLLNSINILLTNSIIHFNLNTNNIICQYITQNPIIINFKYSINLESISSNINLSILKHYFYNYMPYYYTWPIEVHAICFILHNCDLHETSVLTDKDIITISNDYVNSISIFNITGNIFNDTFKNNYLNQCINTLQEYIHTFNDIYILLSNLLLTYTTWDNYAISITYLYILNTINESTKSILDKQCYCEIPSAFYNILIKNISPNFKNRLTINETINAYNRLFNETENVIDD